MAIFDEIDRKKTQHAQSDPDRLARLGREWFTEAREKSSREEADFTAWNRERKKWIADGGGFGDGGWSDGSGDGGGCGD